MSDDDNVRVDNPHYAPTRPMSARPPVRFAAGADFELWFKRFELYVAEARLPQDLLGKELLSLLEDEPFRSVSELGLEDYETIRDTLRQRYSPEGNELQWQYSLQCRSQKPGESLVDFAGALRVLADKAYPNWVPKQRLEVVRNQFIQGVSSPSVQLHLMREMPATPDKALQLALQLESVESAQKRLHRDKRQQAEALAVEPLQSETSATGLQRVTPGTNPAQQCMEELALQVRKLTEEVAQLRTGRSGERREQRTKRPVCWNCHRQGHLRRNCPQRDVRGLRPWDGQRRRPNLN